MSTTIRWAATGPASPTGSYPGKLVQVLVLGAAYDKIADTTCSAATIRRRRDEWITAGVFTALEQAALEAYDKMAGLALEDLCVDGCLVKAPCGGQAAGPSPVDRGKQGTKRSVMVEGNGIPIGVVVAPANTILTIRNLIHRAWTTHRRDQRPTREPQPTDATS